MAPTIVKMGTVQQAQRVAGGFAAPADFAALHADRVEAVCRMQAAEGRELTRVWEIGHELEEVRLAAVPDPDPNPNPGLDPDSDPHPHPALGPNLAQTRSALRSALEGKAEERKRCGEAGALMVQQRELAKRGTRSNTTGPARWEPFSRDRGGLAPFGGHEGAFLACAFQAPPWVARAPPGAPRVRLPPESEGGEPVASSLSTHACYV